MALNERGWEELDPTPVSKPVRFNRQGSTLDEIRHALGILNREAAERGLETFEESDDFDVEDDPVDPQTRWEIAADAAYRTPGELMSILGVNAQPAPQPTDKQAPEPSKPLPDPPQGDVAKPQ